MTQFLYGRIFHRDSDDSSFVLISTQDEEDEVEEEEGGLSKSGKELKKLLGKAAGLNESDADDDDEDDDVSAGELSEVHCLHLSMSRKLWVASWSLV